MQFSEQWLRAYVNPPLTSDELAERLTMAGLEVDGNVPVAPAFSGVVVARIQAVERHPGADKLTVCRVDVGSGELLSIVCGAPNVAAGMRVPCAVEGALLPGDLRIKTARMRGVDSHGMLCSARELGLSDDHGGLLQLADDAPVGQPLRQYLSLDDRRFTIKLTPNRGDCLSVVGVAREVAALTGAVAHWPHSAPVAATSDERLPVAVLASDLCGRFSGRVLRGLDARAPTPGWMKQRLERSGQRSISALVDISNYVMLELGRPTHVFDLDRVVGGLEVRWGRAGERVRLLNGQTVEVGPDVGVIADRRGVEALAGVMGGEATAVSLDTTHVYLEAAFWWPQSIQGRARRYGFTTDAAHRFERGVDFATTVEHIEYISRLILDICGTPATQIGPVDDQVLSLPQRKPVSMRIERCRRVSGADYPSATMIDALDRLGLAPRLAGDCIVIQPPSYRFDLEIEEHVIEEVVRLVGFEQIPVRPPLAPALMRAQPETQRTAHHMRLELAAAGYQEVVCYSFVDAAWEQDFAASVAPIRLLNPIASQMSVMRSTLIGGLVDTLRYNLNRQAARVRIFELGRVFARDAHVADGPLTVAGIAQPMRIAGLAFGPANDDQWGASKTAVDFFDVKGDVERLLAGRALRFEAAPHPALHPGRCARVWLGATAIGWVGELHPRWQLKHELPASAMVFELDVAPLLVTALAVHVPAPRMPAVERDLALWFAESVPAQSIVDAVKQATGADAALARLTEFRLFDLYRPPVGVSSKVAEADANVLFSKEKSLAFRVVLQDTETTLSEAEVDRAMAAIVALLSSRFGARLRK